MSGTCLERDSYHPHTNVHAHTSPTHTHSPLTHTHTHTPQVAVLERRVRDKEQHVRSLSDELKAIRTALQTKEGEGRKRLLGVLEERLDTVDW